MTPDEAAELARIARVQAAASSTPKVKEVLLNLAKKYEAIASSASDAPRSDGEAGSD